MNLTPLDFAILGLLTQNAQSGYQVRQAFETTALGNYSSSPGSIYPALKKLQGYDLVTKRDNDTGKSVFFITTEGKNRLLNWLEEPVSPTDIPKGLSGLILKFAFMNDDISLDTKLTFLKGFENGCQDYLNSLLDYHKKHGQYMPTNGLLAFELGISSYENQIQWARKAIEKLKTLGHEK